MRVAAYARVSTEAEEQHQSLRAQISYYEAFIKQNPRWEYVNVYSDFGRSGTSATKRPGFQSMIADAKAGKLDIIYVKSISRFARNVSDAQIYVQALKARSVEVRFEREGISSFDPASDMVFNVLAAVAQEESRSISENVKWSYRRHAEMGIRRLGNNRVLGYDEVKGVLTPNKDAWIIERMFSLYIGGMSPPEVASTLTAEGARTLRGSPEFSARAVRRMLRNEVYVGDRRIQKQPPIHYLTKRPDPTVAYDSYYLRDNHRGIVDRAVWDIAQARLSDK